MRTFPIMQMWPVRHLPAQRTSIPWRMIEPHEKQALANHADQTLVRLAERGGLSPDEAVAILEDKDYRVRWPRLDGTREAQNARCAEAINRLRELCDAWEKANPGETFL